MMTIKNFEAATGLKRSTVRFYEQHGLLTPETKINGYRLYGKSQLEAVAAIRLGQSLGFSIREIKDLLHNWSSGQLTRRQKRAAVEEKLSECIAKQRHLALLQAYLNATLLWIDRGERGKKPAFER